MILNRQTHRRNSPVPFFTSWVLQLASLQQSRGLCASLRPPLPVFALPASAWTLALQTDKGIVLATALV
jgi:hypothetical protein